MAQGVGAELKDVKDVLQGKKAEAELLRNQLLTAEELSASAKRELEAATTHILELEEQIRLLSSSEGRVISDDSQAHLITEIARLTAQNREFYRVEQHSKDLEVVRKSLESEVTRLTFLLESTKTQLSEARERISALESKRQEVELTLHKRELDIESLKQEISRFTFLRESLETEISNLKETVLGNEAKLEKRRKKANQSHQLLMETKNELQAAKQDLEARLRETQGELTRTQQDFTQKLSFSEEMGTLKTQNLERELEEKNREMQSLAERISRSLKALDEKDAKSKEMETIISTLQSECRAQHDQEEKLTREINKLKVMLEAAQKKREIARSEVIKLSQKLEQKPSGKPDECPSESAYPPGSLELRILSGLKKELDRMYKGLMNVLMTAKESRFLDESQGAEKPGLLIDAEAFGLIERMLNDVVMQTHEAIESPEIGEGQHPAPSWSGRITHAMASIKQSVTSKGPVKLFSCMSAPTERQNATLTMKPKTAQGHKLVSATGGQQDKKPPEEAEPNRRRGSVDNLKYKPL